MFVLFGLILNFGFWLIQKLIFFFFLNMIIYLKIFGLFFYVNFFHSTQLRRWFFSGSVLWSITGSLESFWCADIRRNISHLVRISFPAKWKICFELLKSYSDPRIVMDPSFFFLNFLFSRFLMILCVGLHTTSCKSHST